METRTYADLYELVEALCGVSFASNEAARIRALINSRATKAYRASDYWPRFLVIGEERALSAGYIPYEEGTLDPIDTFLRIHKTAPFFTRAAQEFEFTVTASGAALICGDLDPDSAFVTYKKRHTSIYGTTGSDSTTVPKEWFEYIAHGTYSDFLRAEGQQEKASLADAEAQEKLTDELLRIDAMHTPGLVSSRIFTNSNTQTR